MPSPPKTTVHKLGDLDVKIMTFAKADDILAMHTHSYDDVHITVVARGAVRVHGLTIDDTVYMAGAVIDFEADHPHEIIALVDNSRIVNITKHHRKD